MAKLKSFIKNISVDIAKKKHQCQHNSLHEICKNDKRLKLVVDRSTEFFCVSCAVASLEKDIKKLEQIKEELLK